MKIYKGRTRTVILIGSIVIKFPVIRLISALKSIFIDELPYLIKWLLGMTLTRHKPLILRDCYYDYHCLSSLAYNLLSGIMANIWERRLYRETKNQFLMPTYFSLLGLINIQLAGPPLMMSAIDCWCQIVKLSSMKEAFCDSHCLSKPDNFCWVNGHLMLVDYGNEMCHEFIKKYGIELYNNFSSDYSWEKDKEKYRNRRTK